jgi:hypothetical protein
MTVVRACSLRLSATVFLVVILAVALGGCAAAVGQGDTALHAGRPAEAALHGLPIHPRIAVQLDRVLPLLVAGLDPTIRDLVAAQLDDAYEWATEVERARAARAPLEPTWTIYWDHAYPSMFYWPSWGGQPSP